MSSCSTFWLWKAQQKVYEKISNNGVSVQFYEQKKDIPAEKKKKKSSFMTESLLNLSLSRPGIQNGNKDF